MRYIFISLLSMVAHDDSNLKVRLHIKGNVDETWWMLRGLVGSKLCIEYSGNEVH